MRTFVFILVIFIFSSFSLAEPFNPTLLKLFVPEELSYRFDGSPLTIPVTVTGTPAALWMVITTKDQAENIVNIRNGYLGWHYVNKIDTTVYISPRYECKIGKTDISWDGLNKDGNQVEAGSYHYYLWGYDNVSPRQLVCNCVRIGNLSESANVNVYEIGEDGMPLTNPLIFGNIDLFHYLQMRYFFGDDIIQKHGIHFIWEIGNEPLDTSLLQTTLCAMYELQDNEDYIFKITYGAPVLDPHDYSTFYHCSISNKTETSTMLKWEFINNGEAVLDESWLGWDRLIWNELGIQGNGFARQSCFADRNYIYVVSSDYELFYYEWNKLRCVSFDGDIVFDKMMHDWFFKDVPYKQIDNNGKIQRGTLNHNGNFNKLYSRIPNKWFLMGPYCCLLQMIDTSRLHVDPDDETDMVVFENMNGDYFLDVGYEPNSDPAWFCFDWFGTYTMCRDAVCIDSNNFNIVYTSMNTSTSDNNSFCVMTPDGTGIDYMHFSDDVVVTTDYGYGTGKNLGDRNGGGSLVDSGSRYDGLYMNGARTEYSGYYLIDNRTCYVAFDSCRGVITSSQTSVEDDNPLQFSVEQNSPNPFNPSTVIRFTIPENNRVTIDIYNISGQKIQTLVNDMMKAGPHSITWDAGKYPSGVYVYKVKSGKFEKTMKMTLVK